MPSFWFDIWDFSCNCLLPIKPRKPAMIRSFPYNGLADALGATSEETAPFYQNKPDLTAEKECGILPADNDITNNQAAYKKRTQNS